METLEQVANKLFYTVGNEGISSVDSFIKGAKWQQEQAKRTYGEEDLGKAITMARTFCKTEDGEGYDEYQYTPAEIIQSIKQQ
jgi:hypothetical protein